MNMQPPKRAVTLTLNLQADTPYAMATALLNLATMVGRGELTKGCSGGYDSGYIYEYHQSDGPTHDEYVAQLKAYLVSQKDSNAELSRRTDGSK